MKRRRISTEETRLDEDMDIGHGKEEELDMNEQMNLDDGWHGFTILDS
jgi:hypothetical protein